MGKSNVPEVVSDIVQETLQEVSEALPTEGGLSWVDKNRKYLYIGLFVVISGVALYLYKDELTDILTRFGIFTPESPEMEKRDLPKKPKLKKKKIDKPEIPQEEPETQEKEVVNEFPMSNYATI